MINWFKFIGCLVFLLNGLSFSSAQTEVSIGSSADRFALELSNLKVSADSLFRGNEALAMKNNQLRSSLSQLQDRLQKLSDTNDDLTREVLKLQGVHASRSSKIAQLEKNVFEVDTQAEHAVTAMRADQDVLVRLQTEDEALTHRIVALGGTVLKPQGQAEDPVLSANRNKEKLRLLKMIDASKLRQEIIIQQIANSHKQMPVSVVTIESTGDKRDLLIKIKQSEEEISQLSKLTTEVPGPDQWDEKELRQLDEQVKKLQKNHDELESLVVRMEDKTQKGILTQEQFQEQKRLGLSLADANQENRFLKQQLLGLRQQMVELDKRKTNLEKLSKN